MSTATRARSETPTETLTAVLDTPLGPVTARVGPYGLRRLADEADLEASASAAVHPVLANLAADLDRYFAGQPVEFSVPVDLSGLTEFTQLVLRACAALPYGTTTSYGQLAASVGRRGAARAVGGALKANPVPIVVPCHRVVRGDGSMGGYRGGAARKRFLLALEHRRRS